MEASGEAFSSVCRWLSRPAHALTNVFGQGADQTASMAAEALVTVIQRGNFSPIYIEKSR